MAIVTWFRSTWILLAASAALLLPVPASAMSWEEDISEPPVTARFFDRDQLGPLESEILDRRAGFDVKEVTLKQAISALESAAQIPVAYSPALLRSEDRLVTCACLNVTVEQAAAEILRDTGFTLRVFSGQLVVVAPNPFELPLRLDEPVRVVNELDGLQRGSRAGVAFSSILVEEIGSGQPIPVTARQGIVTGAIRHADSGEPLASAQVTIEGTGLGTLSGSDGGYTVSDVPAGIQVLVVTRIGFRESRHELEVVSGETTSLDVLLSPTVLLLEAVVATGLIDPVEGVRSPISVARLTRASMSVISAGSALQNLQGRMAGVRANRTSGVPGEEVSLMLRTPTSVTQGGSPLLVVDGVILGSSTANIEAMDIESMEVIRGAAAASLYGSRAAGGVIVITTSRGSGLAIGETQFSARTEIGRSQAYFWDHFPRHHEYLMDEAQTTYVDFDGNPVGREDRVAPPAHQAFMDNPYPGPTYDNLRNIYQGGNFNTQSFSVMRNGGDTNFAVTVNRYRESGPLTNNSGYTRSSFRVNLDHHFMDAFGLAISVFNSRDELDEIDASFLQMMRAPPDVDLRQRDADGQYVRVPHPQIAYENPLWTQASRESDRERDRQMASANLRWDPEYWISASATVSLDRQNQVSRSYLPKGTPLSVTTDDPADGSISFDTGLNDTWNAEAQVSLRRDFGRLNVRTTIRTLMERSRNEFTESSGSNFFTSGVPQINATANRQSASSENEVRSTGYLFDIAMDFDGKYIATLLGRRDGSSLFGADNRWHNYYRVAAAYRLSEEPWFNIPLVDEFKLSYARGTAGGRPPFEAQYETWTVGATGPSKGTLGNRNLRPEHTTEQEVMLNMILAERFGVTMTYAWQTTTDQLYDNAIPALTGYESQWVNGGSVEGQTAEITLEAQIAQTENFGWNSLFVADHSKAKIADWPFQCTAPPWRAFCEGVDLYHIHGSLRVRTFGELVTTHGGQLAPYRDEFIINDDGWMVWVGPDNSYTDGISKDLWGTSTQIGGVTYNWGMPVWQRTDGGDIPRWKIASGNHVNLGWMNTFRYRNFTVHTQLQGNVGREIGNRAGRFLIPTGHLPGMDQAGKPDELKKPVAYYNALEGGRANHWHMTKADYLSLRSMSVTYNVGQSVLARLGPIGARLTAMRIGLVGRNVFLLHNCRCPDPQLGAQLDGARLPTYDTGEGAGGYPSSRTLTMEVGVTF